MTPKEITYRKFFARLDEACESLREAVCAVEVAIHELRNIKSEEWQKHSENGNKEVVD